jgi:Xaa-Pro dipeptidase
MVLDFGVKYKGYCADMTRTIYLGNPSTAEKQVYEKLRRVQEYCLQYAKAGMKASTLSKHAKTLLGKDSKYFIHGLGHGIGVEIHELPGLFEKSKDVLEKGNVFTIEPGYYNKKTRIGIRIEDDILINDKGKKEVLTKSPKNLICIRMK